MVNTPIYEYKLVAPLKITRLLKYIQGVLSNDRSYTLCIFDDGFKELFPKDFYNALTLNDGVKLVSDYNDMLKKYSANKNYHIMRVKVYVYDGQIIDMKSIFSTEVNLTNPLGKVVNS